MTCALILDVVSEEAFMPGSSDTGHLSTLDDTNDKTSYWILMILVAIIAVLMVIYLIYKRVYIPWTKRPRTSNIPAPYPTQEQGSNITLPLSAPKYCTFTKT